MTQNLLLIILLSLNLSGFASPEKYSFDEKIDLLYAVDPGQNSDRIKTDLREFISGLQSINGSPSKKIKKIFAATKKQYLHSYSISSFFTDLSRHGTYNCVTGSALFAIIFDELDIPYTVVEVPRHVYLVAYPNTHAIAVESTNLREGLYNWTSYSKNDAIAYLLQVDKVSETDVRIKGVDAIIGEFFYANAEHNFGGLAGMHLMNRAIYFFDRKKFPEAYEQLVRARPLYDGPVIHHMEGAILSRLVEDTDYEDISIVHYLSALYGITDNANEKKRLKANFGFLVQEALKTRRDVAFVDSAEMIVMQNLQGNDLNVFLSIIEVNRCALSYSRGNDLEAGEHARRAYAYDPANKYLEDLVAGAIMDELTQSEEFYTDPVLADAQIVADTIEYPFLNDQPLFLNLCAGFYAESAVDYFSSDDPENGFIFLEKALDYAGHPDLDADQFNVLLAEAYAQAATCLFRLEQYGEAMEWIEKAIALDPGSEAHRHRKAYISSRQ